MSGLRRVSRGAWMAGAFLMALPVGVLGQASPKGGADGSVAARYSGVTVCADCSGIRTTLVLEEDAQGVPTTYQMTEMYEGRAVPLRRTSGTWKIVHGDATDRSATVYQLHPAGSEAVTSFLKVSEDALQMLDGSLRELPASLPHTLRRVQDEVTMVTESSGREVMLKREGVLEVRLRANRTTGYSWTTAPVMHPVLVRMGKALYHERAREGKTGVGGVAIWRFKAVKLGREILTFEYRRPWEKNATAARTEVFSVTVQ